MKFTCPRCHLETKTKSALGNVVRCPGCRVKICLKFLIARELRKYYQRSRN